jgi:hypothetical protein|tara:strand:+ start:444 stop:632 length:189 start_codon:yes stop_codon:yes gene_type:complete
MDEQVKRAKALVRKYCFYGLVLTVIMAFGYFLIQAITFAIGMIVPVMIIAFLVWCIIYIGFK